MKRKLLIIVTFFLIIFTFSGCTTNYPAYTFTPREKEVKTFGFDFREYAEKGFLFTPNEYNGEHKVLGLIRVELHPSIRYQKNEITEVPGYTMYIFKVVNDMIAQFISIEDENQLIEHIYNLAIEWGGDGVTEFNLEYLSSQTDNHPSSSYSYPSISGVIIKRK